MDQFNPDAMSKPLFDGYQPLLKSYDEYFASSSVSRPLVTSIVDYFKQISKHEYAALDQKAVKLFQELGVTFGLGVDSAQRIFPFDLIPRVISASDWNKIERGLQQRVKALNHFIHDIYHKQKILTDKVIPRELVLSSQGYLSQLQQITPAGEVYVHVMGTDIVRNENGDYFVLEDNLRTPSGVSYALTNRLVTQKIFPDIIKQVSLRTIDDYPGQLSHLLRSLFDMDQSDVAVVLTPGPYNAAYYEHANLAKHMGWPLVQGDDLLISDSCVYLKENGTNKRVRVIYRRIDDEYLDPNEFNPDSLIGVPGLMHAYRARNVVIANALGNGVADDKAVFAYVPQMIRYYLDEIPILPQVETFLCSDPQKIQMILNDMKKLVIKIVNKSGGQDVLIGAQASQAELDLYRNRIKQNPRDFVAQPLVELSTCPTWCENNVVPKRIDLRPYIVTGVSSWVMAGALTRVALAENSYVVNSSQGGGSKDTWIMNT
jgi:uncharacterized circularly permuted ATP-grasp superfamily protein